MFIVFVFQVVLHEISLFLLTLYFYSLSIFPPSGDVDFWIPFIQIIIITFFLYIFFTKFFYKENL